MPLSAEEQRRLAELEEALSTDDPDFARSFSRRASATCPHPSHNALEQRRMQHRRARRRQILIGSVMVLLGLAGVVGGVVLTSGVLAVVGFANYGPRRRSTAVDRWRCDATEQRS